MRLVITLIQPLNRSYITFLNETLLIFPFLVRLENCVWGKNIWIVWKFLKPARLQWYCWFFWNDVTDTVVQTKSSYFFLQPIQIINSTIEMVKPGKLPSGKTEIPFEFPLHVKGNKVLYETYHGVFVNIQVRESYL